MKDRVRSERGAAALFIVIFATMLLSIIAITFVTMMVKDQRRAIDDDLSQGAYDASLAGVEDAKRVIMRMKRGDVSSANAVAGKRCSTIQDSKVLGAGARVTLDEVLVKSSDAAQSSEFNQAYTCVKIDLNSPDFLVSVPANASTIVPLHPTANVSSIRVEWHKFQDGDIRSWTDDAAARNASLLQPASWQGPALLRSQLMTPGSSFSLSSLDESAKSGTIFMYPRALSAASATPFSQQILNRYAPGSNSNSWSLQGPGPVISCNKNAISYACAAQINLQNPIPANSTLSFLRLVPMYRDASIRVVMQDDKGQPVAFNGVQPIVDSTGRANDIFRRVEARLSFAGTFTYPDYAIDTRSSVCKNFYVTSVGVDRAGSIDCTP